MARPKWMSLIISPSPWLFPVHPQNRHRTGPTSRVSSDALFAPSSPLPSPPPPQTTGTHTVSRPARYGVEARDPLVRTVRNCLVQNRTLAPSPLRRIRGSVQSLYRAPPASPFSSFSVAHLTGANLGSERTDGGGGGFPGGNRSLERSR